MVDDQFLVVLCTCPDRDVAEHIASTVVAERLAACVNTVPNIVSIYRWQGQLQRDSELLLLIKTHTRLYPALENRVRELHPYDVPELIALPIARGSADYLRWIQTSMGATP